jgi:hypothetical protein
MAALQRPAGALGWRAKERMMPHDDGGQVPSRKWLEFEGGVISGLFNQPEPALERRGRSRHDDG